MARPRVSIDVGGGDSANETTKAAILAAASINRPVEVVAYGNKAEIEKTARSISYGLVHLEIVDCGISHSRAMNQLAGDLKEGKLAAWVTPARSPKVWGALHRVGLIEEGLISPALMAPMPTDNTFGVGGLGFLMDVGLTDDIRDPEVYTQWAEFGSRFLAEQYGIDRPRVGLYNIAAERAPDWLRQIDIRLSERADYVGYAEPRRVREGEVDLWLAMGLIGNGLMKVLESWMPLVGERIAKRLATSGNTKGARQVGEILRGELSYDAFLISPVIGLRSGIVVSRTHGGATAEQIAGGIAAVRRYLPNKED